MPNASRYVNTITGAVADIETPSIHGGGKTHPAAVRPYGMVQLGPDTITGGDNGPGYSYHHETIEGFSFNRLSGIGAYGDMGNLQVMPTTGEIAFHSGTNAHDIGSSAGEEGWASSFRHETEITEAGYYAVTLDRYGIRADMTAAARAGMLRFEYGGSAAPNVLIDLARRIGGRSTRQFIRIRGTDTIEGWIHCPPEGGGFRHGKVDNTYTLFFYGQFSEPWASYGLWNKQENLGAPEQAEEDDLGFYACFPATSRRILFKAGISYVSTAGAQANMKAEMDHWEFDRYRSETTTVWDEALSSLQLHAGTEEQKEVFYSALYHTLLDPRIASDADGQYRGANRVVGQSESFCFRTVFSGWDVFRSQFPLLTLLRPEVVNDQINTLIRLAEQSGRTFFRWELLGNDTETMVGDPGVAVTVDAYMKGIRCYDENLAYRLCMDTALAPYSNRMGREDMNRLGYVPESISVTLENVYADWCIYRFAMAKGDLETAGQFKQRAESYKNIYNPEIGWMRRKDRDGEWMDWSGKYDTRGCVESNVFQQHWFVPHDVAGLIRLMGKQRFLDELEALFEGADLTALWNDNYNHSNEPCHMVPHLFIYAGQPWRTQYWVRKIQEQAYRTGPYGYCGNEDVGQMSAWYILTSLGFHPACPGNNVYLLNTPLFEKVELKLMPEYHACTVSDRLIIETVGDPGSHPYIRGVELNGAKLSRAWITHEEIVQGGVLRFYLGESPDENWGVDLPPPSLSDS